MNYLDIGFVLRSAVMQVIVFSMVPFLWWLFRHRKDTSFFKWVGLHKPKKSTCARKVLLVIIGYFGVWIVSSYLSQDISSNFEGLGVAAIVPSFLVCFIQNGLCEEILFRGFIGKRFISKFGTTSGIWLQAILFGLMHIVLALMVEEPLNISLVTSYFILPTIGGWMLGYIDEKIYNGSIIPSVLLHGVVNFTRDMILAL